MPKKKKSKSTKGWFKTVNTIRSSKGTAYVRISTKKYPRGAGHKKVVFRKKKK